MASTVAIHPAENSQIPVDLFVSRKHPDLTRGDLGFADSSGNIVFRVSLESRRRRSSSSSSCSAPKRVLLDAAGVPLISMYRHQNGSWQGYKGNGGCGGEDKEKDLIFRVERKVKTLTRIELKVFLVGGNSTCELRIKGCPFQRSCTIYTGDSIQSIVAQSNLMYKLHQVFVKRSEFRVTIFPGNDHALVAALILVFLDGHM
ncbi:protein LURP-one-related 7 [Tripterygium wilfordii]|uniref:Protein LURP-one-related 7 n=1 Tax=Tripterygium wilfordii TaxID=458696 RepID=A0A7J7DDQ4_TRIWF|nr:protein LURP-one-related 7 [Tripterygium wilfordii]KAF5744462.1 protein LURP-one-related 7 [Tripterygium wilfordii]